MTDGMDVRASVRHVPMSAQKVRLVLDLIRGMDVNDALAMLPFISKAAAKPVYKLLRSAVANAEENVGLSRDDLFIYRIHADEDPTRQWRRFGARGRFKPLKRRSSHITVILREREVERA